MPITSRPAPEGDEVVKGPDPDLTAQFFVVAPSSSEALRKTAAALKENAGASFAGMEVVQFEATVAEGNGTVIIR
jgi:hypothetical protein